MRNRARRYISLIVVMLLALGCFAPAGVFAATGTKVCSDVKGTNYEKAVTALISEGIITGYPDGTFVPEGDITRAEVSKIFGIAIYDNYEGSEKSLVSESEMKKFADDSFADLEYYNWAKQFIGICAKMGIVEGYGNRTFKPGNNISYNELTAMVVRAANYDMSKVEGSWPENYIKAGEEMKLYEGVKDFKPYEDGKNNATRGNTAIIINNAIKTIKEACKAGYAEGNKVTQTTNTMRLSLDDAIKRMKSSGMLAQLASANRDADEALAKGYGETISNYQGSLSEIQGINAEMALITGNGSNIANLTAGDRARLEQLQSDLASIYAQGANAEIAKFQRDFINSHIDDNYQADINNIEATTYQLYYGIIQAEDNVAACKAALDVEEQKTANTKKKYEVGMASQLEVQQAEMSLLNAQSTLIQAENTLESAQLNFKMLLNVDYRTNLVLTTPIKKTKDEVTTQANAISTMLSKNMTLKYYDYLYDLTGKTVDMLSSVGGAEYSKALAAQSQTLVASNQTYNSLRANMISAYSELPLLEKNIETMESTVAMAEKGLEIANIQFAKGMITQADLDNSELSLMQANLGLTNAIATYNLAIYDINYNAGVGTSRVTFS